MKRWTWLFVAALLSSACGDPPPACGDLVVDPGEDCDGAAPCRADCTLPRCGDAITDAGEACDDGNTSDNDACKSDCTTNVCGDGAVNPAAEECDDTNASDNDACKNNCTSNVCGDGALNPLQELCDDANTIGGDNCRADCQGIELCGDGLVDVGEVCDDSNNTDDDGCRADCLGVEVCGDGLLDVGEVCDDNNVTAGDDCRSDCAGIELCGDGLFDPARGEVCDDNNTIDGDSCRADCLGVEVCGDGLLDTINGEQCDDGNVLDNDGCDADCLPTRVVSLSVGTPQICAIFRTGDVRCWGDEVNSGVLGYANTLDIGDDETPESAGDVNIGGSALQLATGGVHTCALLDNGNVRCWGNNVFGSIGYGVGGNIGDNETPASAGDVPVGGPVAQITAGSQHTCALLTTGNVRCWGRNLSGQLGYGNTLDIGDNETPAATGDVNIGGAVVQIVAGGDHSCALLNNGNVRCWGEGFAGELGYGNSIDIGDNELPSSAGDVSVGGTVLKLTAGQFHTCALLDNGNVRCWGSNTGGQLGYGNTNAIGDNELPSSAGDVSIGGTAVELAAGDFHTCARLTTGEIRCWGFGFQGALGYGNTNTIGDNELPSTAGDVPVGGVSLQISAAGNRSCALLDTGAVRCWGLPILGYGNLLNIGDDETPASVGDVPVF